MTLSADRASLEAQIAQWRQYLRHRQAIHSQDVAELEDHLRKQVEGLIETGLAADEAFLIAVKRMGSLDALSREFAREHCERLWKQLVMTPSGGPGVDGDAGTAKAARTEAFVVFGLAVAGTLTAKAAAIPNSWQIGRAHV